MDGTRGYYAKQNKSVRKRQLSYDLSDMKNFIDTAGGRGGFGEGNETRWDWEGDKP